MRTDRFHCRQLRYDIIGDYYVGTVAYARRFASYVPQHLYDACDTHTERKKLLQEASYSAINEISDIIVEQHRSLPEEHDIDVSIYNIVPCLKFDDEDIEYFKNYIIFGQHEHLNFENVKVAQKKIERSLVSDASYYFLCFTGLNVSFKIEKDYINTLKLKLGKLFSMEAEILDLVYDKKEIDHDPQFRLTAY